MSHYSNGNNAGGAAIESNGNNSHELMRPESVRKWLGKCHPKQLELLDKFEIELRLGRLSTSSTAVARSTSAVDDEESSRSGGAFSSTDRRLVTSRTVQLLRTMIGSTRWKNAAQLMMLLRGLGMELQAAGGFREPAIGNVVRRVMFTVRDEVLMDQSVPKYTSTPTSGSTKATDEMKCIEEDGSLRESFSKQCALDTNNNNSNVASNIHNSSKASNEGTYSTLSLASMLWAHPQHVTVKNRTKKNTGNKLRSDSFSSVDSSSQAGLSSTVVTAEEEYPPIFYEKRPELRQGVMEAIQEMMSELEDLHKNINDQATNHIHAGEIILTYGRSKTVELFLKAAAAKQRNFSVVVCEGAPHYGGHAMAQSLAKAGIDTTVIHDSATFALMARVNKVILPAHAVLANGGLVAPSGSNMVASCAKQNSVPVVSITGMFKLCAMYPHEGQDTLNDFVSPSSVLEYHEFATNPLLSKVDFVNPVHDYIAPQFINLYITNIGAFQPSYIYRLLAEYYHSDDWESFE